MKHTIKFIIVLFSLVVTGTTSVWGITEDDIIVNVLPNSSAGTVTVTVSGMEVTITATPATDYFIDASHIIAEKMVDPSVSHHAPGLSSSLPISGSNPFTFTIPDGYTGAYVTVSFYKKSEGFIQITSLSEIDDMNGQYQLTADVSGLSSSLGEFKGALDGGLHKIIGSSAPLFTSTDGAIIRNIIFEDVNISSGDTEGDAGAVTSKAGGDTRIYNCGILPTSAERDAKGNITGFYGSSVSGTRYVGGLVGFLDGTSRVINCYSYANVSGGSHVGGIVGYNNVATTATNLKTMVMNCMFYGEVSGSSIAPIYNGEIITNVGDGENTGVSNYNYFRLESAYIQNTGITKVYNCALGAETRFLQRFEFFRHMLNSHRELAAWWATGSMDNKDEMMKWVLEPAQIGSSAPFPILKAPGYYSSVVNIDAENAPTTTERNKGGKLGTLSVTIQSGSGAVFGAPTGASITKSNLTLNITDKDPDHFNFNYYKVQLPYYNDIGTGNYTGNRVVTGWKIVSVTTDGSVTSYNDFTTGEDAPAYNFADRKCINKDLYSVSGRVFNQGAYWDVPEGVTGITIQPYWAKAAYVADAYPDVVYSTDMKTAYNVPNVGGGEKYKNNTNYNIAGEQQKVFTTISNAVTNANGLNKPTDNTVHDYAVVLVGNVHQYNTNNIGSNYKYTVTTIDLDHDNEPDYSLMLRNDGRNKLHPAKWDFLNIVGLGMAQKSTGGTGSYNQGIFQPLYWFETTNTSLFRVTQFEYDNSSRIEAPLILQGGVMEQWVSGQSGGRSNNTTYFHVGGNVWFKEFHRGTHQDQTYDSKHPPVSVTGGDYDEFYLTGLYTANVDSYADNAECYINGGRFGTVAGAAMEGIGKDDGADNTGNITWQVQNADIKEFFAGGINAAKPVTGNLSTTITGGKIDLFCGGPKFGDMSTGKTVTTNATNCIFGTFFGAGYGGNSYSRQAPRNHNNMINFPHNDGQAGNDASWNAWLGRFYTQDYSGTYGGVSTQFSYQFLPMSGNADNCGRIFVEYVKFSLATCRDVTSTLTGCKITGNFYGGGSLGKVDGPVASTLTNCEVQGSVFGAGFSASLPSVEVDATSFATEPYYYTDLGTYREGVKGPTTTYTWEKKTGNSWVDNTNHILYTTEDLTALGAVTGTATLTIDGTTTVAHSVYGGGEESGVGGDTEVSVTGGTIGTTGKGGAEYGNVFGGGKGKADDVDAGLVKGNTNINISQAENQTTTIIHNVYGGGAFGSVGTFTYDDTTGLPDGLTEDTGTAKITITGGTFGSDGKENGMIFGSSRGSEGDPKVDTNIDKIAWVGNTNVIIGTSAAESNANPWIKGSVYGGGENGHNYQNGHVTVHSGTIGITDSSVDGGARYSTRGNVYGGGCGTDTFDRGEGDNKKTYYNFNAGIVLGNTQIDIDGGHIVHNVYGGGAMGTVGTYTLADDAYHAEHTDVPVGMPYECKTGGNCTINITGGLFGMTNATMTGHGNDGPDDFGHIFGAGRGYSKDPNVYPNIESCAFFNNTDLTIGGTALVCGSVYGGSESGHVMNNTSVKITGGQIGCGEGRTAAYTDSDFASESLPTTNHWTYTEAGMGAPYDQYASSSGTYSYTGDFAYIPEADRKATSEGGLPVATDGRTFYGNVFAGGSGYYPYAPGFWLKSAGHIGGTASVELSGGHILNNLYGGCEMADIEGAVTVTMTGGTIGVPRTSAQIKANPNSGNIYGAGMGDKRIFFNTSTNVASATVDISNGTVYGAVYGGGEDGHVMGNVTTTISQPAEKTTVIGCDGQSGYDGNVFGAGQGHIGALTAGVVGGNASLTITGGTLNGSAYGGGRIASVGTYFAMATIDDPNNPGQKIPNPLYGKMQDGDDHGCLTVSLTGGTIEQNVYGGCMGTTTDVLYGESKNVLVELNKDKTATDRGCAVKGDIFGCNNVNSTPQGDVTVHVYATQNAASTQIANANEVTTAKVKGRYDVNAVYGGGNLAVYNPVTPYTGTSGSKTKVIIEGCDLTSIETVYGGGNAAAVPETDVTIRSAYEIGYLFGGGNGKDDIAPGVPNPGADVGTPDHGTTTYGTGNANTLMEGGLIHEAYGGSNTKGIIKGSIYQITDPKDPSVDPGCCELVVEKIVGAGKYADIDGDVNMTLSCQPNKKVNLLFAGADEANVNGNITLNITNGHFGKVFGGNNLGGVIKGKITVNVEETGCQPIKIDDLYLGGNEAAYSVFGYYESNETHDVTGNKILKPRTSADDEHTPVENPAADETHSFPYAQPELNIISCTYIGNVFGGGFGEGAVMYANPTVNVNMVKGAYGDNETVGVPKVMTDLGLDVTKTAPNPDKLGIIRNVFGGGDAADIGGNTTVNIGTAEKVYLTSEPTYLGDGNYNEITADEDPHKGMFEVAAKGAYIIGSVFGGGNAADVLGNTNVTVSGGYVFNGIFGGGYAGSVGTFERSTAEADVNIYGHTAHTGCIGKPTKCKTGTGKCTVVVDGGQIGPLSVATEGMNRSKADGGPVPEGWVWGAGQGLVEDPAEHPDTHFTSYVGSTDVTIGGTALIMESIIGGGEFGRVLGNTLVKIEGGQIGIGEGKVDGDNKPIRYTDDQFVNPLTTSITSTNALAECSHYPYGKVIEGKKEYLPYDPYYEDYPTYVAAHPEYGPASTSNPSDGKTWIGCVFGGGSGYMPYKNASGYDWCPSAGLVEGDTEVRISGGHILTNVYGGNEITDVKGKSIVKMTGGTIGVPRTLEQIVKHPLTCYLFGAGKGDERSRFYNYTNTGSVEVEISGGIIYGSVFGGSEDGHVTGDIKMDIKPGAVIGTHGTSYVDGNVFGGGRGFSGNTLTAGNVGGNVTLNISGGDILGSVYGGGRLASVGTYLVETTDANYGKQIPDVGDDKHGHITINISGGTIGNDKEYIYNPTAEQKAAIPNTTFDYQNHLQYTKGGNVFTAGMGRLYALDNTTVLTSWKKLGQCKSTTLNMTGGTVKSSVYGGGEIGIVAQNATLNIDGGTVGTKVVDPNDATKYYYFGSVFGGGKGSTANVEGISEAGTTQGNVEVHLNKTVASDDAAKGAIVHQVFGCNDMNGSPKGNVTVHVYATQNADKDNISTKYDKGGTETFDVEAVYGGGNLAAYEPEGGKNTTKSTNVIIDGCGLTSIKQVYGGGNAASTPATNVTVNGTYEIMELFGGGNGFDNLPDGRPNPGANVGYKNYTIYTKDGEDKWVASDDPAYDTKEERTAGGSGIVYGTGQASINVYGGTIHRVFGGSNTKGNVRQTAVTLLEESGGCTFCVDEAYGGGKSAPMDAEAKLLMACIPGLQAAYGGAEAAAIKGNVTLNITNGTFDRVFGGNNLSGTIDGSITVNIQEVGCRPIIIGELYGGGNQAAYSVYGYDANGKARESGTQLYDDPQVNVKSFTSIGKVFGGGFGDGATMVGNPTVNVNEIYGRYYNDDRSIVAEGAETPNHYPIPSHAKGKMGAIHTVFGGGNAAKVMGNTTVNIATQAEVYIVKQVTAGETLPAGCYTRSGAGTTADPFVYTTATGTASADVTYYEKKDVLGVDIRDNIYGGGNNAEVTGNTNVNIGKKAE